MAKFKKGESGNPAGRPKGSLKSKKLIDWWLNQPVVLKNPLSGNDIDATLFDELVLAQIAKARAGSVTHFRELMDRFEGKAVQFVEADIRSAGKEIRSVTFNVVSGQPAKDDSQEQADS